MNINLQKLCNKIYKIQLCIDSSATAPIRIMTNRSSISVKPFWFGIRSFIDAL
jgi:hypothetical protein